MPKIVIHLNWCPVSRTLYLLIHRREVLLKPILRFDRSKMELWVAIRNTIGVVGPLILGWVFGAPEFGLAASLGALLVSYSDGPDTYFVRARRMFASSFISTAAILAGALASRHETISAVMTAAWAFAAGLVAVLGSTAGSFGIASLTLLLIYSAVPLPEDKIFTLAGISLLGGFFQAGLALFLWPLRRFEPAKRALERLYEELSALCLAPVFTRLPPRAGDEIENAHIILQGLERNFSYEAWRYRALLSQAERIRIRIISLLRVKRRLHGEQTLNDFLLYASGILQITAETLHAEQAPPETSLLHAKCESLAQDLKNREQISSPFVSTIIRDAVKIMTALNGQFRAAQDLADHVTPKGSEESARADFGRPWPLRLRSVIATLLANMTIESEAFRHAIRLAIGVAVGDLVGRHVGIERSYWLPMTVALVLKPEFTSTFTTSLLRVTGTIAGLFIATLLFHFLPHSIVIEVILIGIFVFSLRYLGPANYGIFAMALSGYLVIDFAMVGIGPKDIVVARTINTVLGGGIALLVYFLWPTREAEKFSQALGRLFESQAAYFHFVLERAGGHGQGDKIRHEVRLARSNLSTSLNHTIGDPSTTRAMRSILTGIQAAANRFIHSVMSLEAAGPQSLSQDGQRALSEFATAVEQTLQDLGQSLKQNTVVLNKTLPDLRALCDALAKIENALPHRSALLFAETDRITNSLNTLREHVARWIRRG